MGGGKRDYRSLEITKQRHASKKPPIVANVEVKEQKKEDVDEFLKMWEANKEKIKKEKPK